MTKKEFVTLSIAAGLIILISVTITASVMYLKIPIFSGGGEERERSGAHFQISHAVRVCDKRIMEVYGDSIYTKTVDSLSNRYDETRNVNLAFTRLSVKKSNLILDYQIICTVSAGSNRIINLEKLPLNSNAKFRM